MTTKWTVSGHYTFENKQMQMIMNVPIIRPIILNEMNHQFCVAVGSLSKCKQRNYIFRAQTTILMLQKTGWSNQNIW